MNLNPLTLLDILLADLVNAKWRRVIHNLVLLAVAVVAIWLAADQDWWQAVLAVAGAIYAASNRANTPDEASGNDLYDENGDDEDEVPETGTYGDYQ